MGILLVDDDPAVQGFVEVTLQASGLSVVSVGDGLSALDIAISEKPDVILADLSVQGIDIATFIKKIQRRVTLANTPIILLQGDTAIAPELAGAYAVLKKPLDPILLSKEVKKQMGILEEEVLIEEILLEEPIKAFEAVEVDDIAFDLPGLLESESEPEPSPAEIAPPVLNVSKVAIPAAIPHDIDSDKADVAIRKIVHDVVERVAWEIVPGIIEMAMPKTKIQALVEQVVWEIVPPLAEIEIKKEIKRLQPDEGFAA